MNQIARGGGQPDGPTPPKEDTGRGAACLTVSGANYLHVCIRSARDSPRTHSETLLLLPYQVDTTEV